VAEVTVGGRARGLPAPVVRRVVETVLSGERRDADISVSFVGAAAMRALNREHKGHDRPTDVLAFALRHRGTRTLGDIYIAPMVARAQAARLGIRPRRELIRLVVHGTLHVLGHDHPEGPGRERSAMWRRQERYVERLA
jgi:probable rRNA maturation factor